MTGKEIEILEIYPPNFETIVSLIPAVRDDKHAIFAYKEKIYNPYKETITPDRELHEKVHFEQQGNDTDTWWQKYLSDAEFRFQQELEAYSRQYNFVKINFAEAEHKMRKGCEKCKAYAPHIHEFSASKATEWGLDKMAQALSGETYGRLLSYAEARSKIRSYAKNIDVGTENA